MTQRPLTWDEAQVANRQRVLCPYCLATGVRKLLANRIVMTPLKDVRLQGAHDVILGLKLVRVCRRRQGLGCGYGELCEVQAQIT